MTRPTPGPPRRRAAAAATLGAALLLFAGPARADSVHQVTVDERDCQESAITRMPVDTQALRALVPQRYGLLAGTLPGSSRTLLNTYTCAAISVDGAPVNAGGPQPTVVSMWSAPIGSRDGVPATGSYLLSYATNNPVLFAKLHTSGLPVAFAPASTVTGQTTNGVTTLDFTLRGAVDYDLTSVAPEPTTAAAPSTARWYHDSDVADVRLVFQNDAPPPTASTVTADFTRFEPYATMAVTSLTPLNAAAFYLHGSWTDTTTPVVQ